MPEVELKDTPRRVQDLFNKGFGALERGNLEYAIDMLSECVMIEPLFLQGRKFLRAAEIRRLGKKATSPFAHAVSTIAGAPLYVKVLGLQKSGKLNHALVLAEKLLRRDPLNPKFVMLFARSEPALHGYILSLLPNWADAEEVLQQTSVVLWRKFDQHDWRESNSGFAQWACRIAQYEVFNFRRKHRRDPHVFSDELVGLLAQEAIAETDQRDAERRALSGCLAKLADRDRDLVKHCYAEGTTIKQVADRMGCTANSVYKVLSRIRAALLRCIQATLAAEGYP